MILQCIIQHICTVCVIYTVFFERIILFNSLVIQILSVNQKDNQVNSWLVTKQLCKFKTAEGFSGTGAGENIAVTVYIQNTLFCSLNRIYLIRSHHHQNWLSALDDHIFIKHFCQCCSSEKLTSKRIKVIDSLILFICPEKYK